MNELKYILITLVAVFICQKACSQEQKPVSFVHGLEWGGSFNYYHFTYSLFLTEDQFLAETHTKEMIHHLNGFACYNAGIALRRMEAMLHVGYQGFDRHIQLIPIGIKAMAYRREDRTGVFGFADGTVGIPTKARDKVSPYCALGVGYTMRISREICLDHSLGICYSVVSPTEVYDPYSDCMVRPQNLRESWANILGIRFSTALCF